MSGINVLSDSLMGLSRLEKVSGLKGKNATDSFDNAAAEFAAMLSGLTNFNADPMGQNSIVGENLETGRDQDIGQDQDTLVQNLGYNHFVFSCLSQPMVLSDLPAGKEANSGNGVNQGPEVSLSANSNLNIDTLGKLFQDLNEVFGSKGMTSQMPQGNNPGTSELDKYRQVITALLAALSGEITESSPEGAGLASEHGASERQEMMRLVQGWVAITDKVDKAGKTLIIDGQSSYSNTVGSIEGDTPLPRGDFQTLDEARPKTLNTLDISKNVLTESALQEDFRVLDQEILKVIPSASSQILEDFLTNQQGTGRQALSSQASSLLSVLNQVISQVQETNLPQGDKQETNLPQGDKNEMLQAQSNKLEAILNQLNVGKNTRLQTDTKQESTEIDLLHSNSVKNLQEPSEPSEPSEVKTSQHSNPGIGLEGKVVTSSVADGKTVAIPVWEQISTVFREKVSIRNQELKELDIQLHPADLGRIRIGLRWENGQVHLQVHASEAATGQIIQNQLSELRNTLTNQGVNCGELQMGQQGRDQQQNQNHQGDQFYSANPSYVSQIEEEEPFPLVDSHSPGERNDRINVTA